MRGWTCPNVKCVFDKQLEEGQICPLCMEKAREFSDGELDNLWKQKWELAKSIKKAKEQEKLLEKLKFCPKCGSTNINFLAFYRPSTWKCLDCGYEGAFILEGGEPVRKAEADESTKERS